MTSSVAPAWREGALVAGGVRLATFSSGSVDPDAPAVVLLHGLGEWSDAAWGRLVPHLDPRMRCVALDLPGFGASDKPAVRYDVAFFRRVLADALAQIAPAPVRLVAHSLGGFLAADLAGAYPERVARLALIAPAGFARTPRTLVYALAAARAPWLFTRAPSRRFVVRLLERGVHDRATLDVALVERACALAEDPALRAAFASVYAGALHAFVHAKTLHSGFARYRGPVFCAWGLHDRYIGAAALRSVQRVYPHAHALLLERSGHLPMLEEPDALGAALRAFLA